MRIALTGNPNSGKTTLFNRMTGKIEKVGNWAGVTIDKKEGIVKKTFNQTGKPITVVDLPGAYSISPFTSEESITSEFIKNENPDIIINTVDATNLSRSLFFTTELLELKIPVIIALNKSDLTKRKETSINIDKLAERLGCPVIETIATATGSNGLEILINKAIEVGSKDKIKSVNNQGIEIKDLKNIKSVEISDADRFELVKEIIEEIEDRKISSKLETSHDIVDRILVHKWIGILIFGLIMWGVLSISVTIVGPLFANVLVGWIDKFHIFVEGILGENVSPVWSSLLLDGIIGGVGAVVGFLPLIMVLFFLLALLEDCGYMARVAVVMDRFFKRVGLSGKSIIPMIIGTGCSVPGIMATRTIKDERQRRTMVMLTPFMPCGAKLPIIALFAGIFFNGAAWVGTFMYFLAIGIIALGATIIIRITGEKGVRSFFIMELPEYKFPSIKRAWDSMIAGAKEFIIKAGTIILLCNAVIQMMQTFNWQFQVVEEGAGGSSILASLASPLAFVLIPLGFGTWQLAAAAITGFIAKENVVGTLAVVYSITNFISTDESALVSGGSSVASIMGLTSAAALSYLVFNLYIPPCVAAVSTMYAEMKSKKWFWGAISFQFALGYITAFIVYQVGTLLTEGKVGKGFLPGSISTTIIIGYILYLMNKGEKERAARLTTNV